MKRTEAFVILGIEATKDEKAIKSAYRERLAAVNPEDDQEGFKELRGAYEEACRYAREPEGHPEEEKEQDTTPSGLWMEKAIAIYGNIRTRQDVELWKALFDDDIFLSLEEEENCRLKLLRFLTEHFKLPTQVWKLLDRKLSITGDAKALREIFPANFMHYIISRCERGEDLEFSQFEGPETADYDLFLEYYDRCWQALHDDKEEEAGKYLQSADALGIRHPAVEISRANLMVRQGQVEEAVALLEGLLSRYPGDAMIGYNYAELLWSQGDNDAYRKRAVEIYQGLKAENGSHYMANLRLTEWHYGQGEYREAKKCAEKVLAAGGDEAFMELLAKVNGELEKGLEARYRESGDWEAGLELSWCYLQDGRISKGIRLAQGLKGKIPPERESEYHGLLAKLFVEQAEYEESAAMAEKWETSLQAKLEKSAGDEEEHRKNLDRLRQTHLIRMQCYHNLGFRDREKFALAIREGEGVLTGDFKDVGVLLEMAQIYTEMEEYDQSLEISRRLVDEFQVFAAYASSLEAYRRLLDAGGVVRAAGQCIRYFPAFVKSYEYLAKVYLDLERAEDFEKVLEDAEKNGVESVLLDAYRFQMGHEVMEIGELNGKLKEFRRTYFKRVEDGETECYGIGLPILTEYLYHFPDDFMLVERAIFHRAAHRLKEAREDFEKALYINPSNPYALNGLSFTYKYLGEYERALFYIKKAILYIDKEMSPVIYADMGNLYGLLGDAGMAYSAYRQYEHLIGEIRSNWFGDNLAEYAMRAGRAEEAVSIYERFYARNTLTRYEKLVNLYNSLGRGDRARQTLRLWAREIEADMGGMMRKGFRRLFHPSSKGKGGTAYYPDYYFAKGWTELLYGEKGAALRAFDRMFRNGPVEGSMEGKICDAVFACILCGNEANGRKYAAKLQEWLANEKKTAGRKYHNRQKGHLQMEFLAAYYTEPPRRLQELLDREAQCEICHFCINPLCKEMEGARILFLLRTGHRQEARDRLLHNLEVQPWDEYMLAIRHVAFGDKP